MSFGNPQIISSQGSDIAPTPPLPVPAQPPVGGGPGTFGGGITYLVPSGGDDGAALQAAINVLLGLGAVTMRFVLGPGVFNWATTVQIPRGLTAFSVVGQGMGGLDSAGVTSLQLNGVKRAFGFNKIADYDTFQNITLDGFSVDLQGVNPNSNSIVLGNNINGTQQIRLNYKNIVVKNINVINCPTQPTGGPVGGAAIVSLQLSVQNTDTQQITGTFLVFDNLKMVGGRFGVVASANGTPNAAFVPRFDQVFCTNSYHDTGLQPNASPGATSWGNFDFGGNATGGYLYVSNCRGFGSNDVGIEFDQFDNATVTDCEFTDAYNSGVYWTNFNNPTGQYDACKRTIRNVRVVNNVVVPAIGAFAAQSRGPQGVDAGTACPDGHVLFDNCVSVIQGVVNTTGFTGDGFHYGDVNAGHTNNHIMPCASLTFRNCQSIVVGLNYNAAGGTNFHHFRLNPTSVGGILPVVTWSGNNIARMNSTQAGAGAVTVRPLFMNLFACEFASDNGTLSVDHNVTTESNSVNALVTIGVTNGCVGFGDLPRVKVKAWAGDTTPTALTVAGTAGLTIAPEILYAERWGLGKMPVGTVLNSGAANQAPNVQCRRWVTPTYPQAASSITPGASPFTYTNADKFDQTVYVSGGTVTAITRNGVTTGVLGGAFDLAANDSIVVFYTVAPTMNKQMDR